ncbi:unnamed protein product [Parajaminaea phylloscopi]
MPDRDDLLSMGFAPDRVDWALHVTQNSGLQSALDHLEANQEKPVPDYKTQSSTGPAASAGDGQGDYDEEDQAALMEMLKSKGQGAVDAAMGTGQASDLEAKSIKCVDCGKIMKNSAFASFHAEKSGHTNFEESTEEVKPLTEEEKKQRLAELRQKLAEKRAAQTQVDAKEARANEQIRRKAGQDMGLAKEELQKKELLKDQQRKAAEKKADLEARARVKAQIEADKRERAEKAAREKALREGKTDVATPAPSRPLAAPVSSSASSASEARLRVRAPGGQWMGTLPAETTLSQVESMVREAGKADGPLKFSQTFPRKFFTDDEKAKTLKELGLVPNAALEASPAS